MSAWLVRAWPDAEWEPPMAWVMAVAALESASAPALESALVNGWCSTRSHSCLHQAVVAAALLSMLALHDEPPLAPPPDDVQQAPG